MVIYITFSFPKFKVRFCDGEDRPGEDGSDYEIWEPSGKITKECLMMFQLRMQKLMLSSKR